MGAAQLYRGAAGVMRDKLGDAPNVRALEASAARMEGLASAGT